MYYFKIITKILLTVKVISHNGHILLPDFIEGLFYILHMQNASTYRSLSSNT